MKLVTTERMRELDRRTIAEFGVPGAILMERAGMGVAMHVRRIARLSGGADWTALLFAGQGNNGGDAFAAARLLKEAGWRVEVWLAGDSGKVRGDALEHLNRMRNAGIRMREASAEGEEPWNKKTAEDALSEEYVVIDGLLGVGAVGPARGAIAAAIRRINRLSERSPVVSIDAPSGLNCDTGDAVGETVVADVTVTMGLPKTGLAEPRALNFVGNVEVVDIGVPAELTASVAADKELITLEDLRGLVRRRDRAVHKGTFGHVLVIGGAAGYAGAIAMAARAALRSGAGLVTALVPESIRPTVACMAPEAMAHAGLQTADGSLASDALSRWDKNLNEFDAVLIGPGMTTREQTRCLVEQTLSMSRAPLVMDADALNVCAGRPDIIKRAFCPVVITPHPGETARLLGCSIADVQRSRFEKALEAAESAGAVTALKGAGTVVAAPGLPLHINMTGNPGMATGGMGDVLAGLLVGLCAQGLTPFDATRMAVYIHGRAGDNVAWRTSRAGMIAGDVIKELPNVLGEVMGR